MHLGQAFIALSLALGTAQAVFVTIYYYHHPHCKGQAHRLEVNGDSCHSGNLKIASFQEVNRDDGGTITFYQDGAACVGDHAYTEDLQYVKHLECYNMRHGEGGSVG